MLAAANVISDQHNLLIPDVVVAPRELVERGGLGLAPEDLLLAVEVESPSTRRRDRTLKREVYHEWGVPHVWLVDPVEETAGRFGSPEPLWLDLEHDESFGERPRRG